jgi:hypothetical protein
MRAFFWDSRAILRPDLQRLIPRPDNLVLEQKKEEDPHPTLSREGGRGLDQEKGRRVAPPA